MRQPRLVYGRMTGWGQTGTLAQAAGHDLDVDRAIWRGPHAMVARGNRRPRR